MNEYLYVCPSMGSINHHIYRPTIQYTYLLYRNYHIITECHGTAKAMAGSKPGQGSERNDTEGKEVYAVTASMKGICRIWQEKPMKKEQAVREITKGGMITDQSSVSSETCTSKGFPLEALPVEALPPQALPPAANPLEGTFLEGSSSEGGIPLETSTSYTLLLECITGKEQIATCCTMMKSITTTSREPSIITSTVTSSNTTPEPTLARKVGGNEMMSCIHVVIGDSRGGISIFRWEESPQPLQQHPQESSLSPSQPQQQQPQPQQQETFTKKSGIVLASTPGTPLAAPFTLSASVYIRAHGVEPVACLRPYPYTSSHHLCVCSVGHDGYFTIHELSQGKLVNKLSCLPIKTADYIAFPFENNNSVDSCDLPSFSSSSSSSSSSESTSVNSHQSISLFSLPPPHHPIYIGGYLGGVYILWDIRNSYQVVRVEGIVISTTACLTPILIHPYTLPVTNPHTPLPSYTLIHFHKLSYTPSLIHPYTLLQGVVGNDLITSPSYREVLGMVRIVVLVSYLCLQFPPNNTTRN